MASVQESAVAHYLGKGISKDVAVGIVSVLMVESGLNPTAENNSGTDSCGVLNAQGAYGVAQWNGARQQALASFAAKKGAPASDLNTQLDFVLTECANSYATVWAAIRQTGITYTDFITIFVDDYENPADKAGEISKALAYATPLYAETIEPLPTPAVAPAHDAAPAPPAAAPAPSPSTSAAIALEILASVQQLIASAENILKGTTS